MALKMMRAGKGSAGRAIKRGRSIAHPTRILSVDFDHLPQSLQCFVPLLGDQGEGCARGI